MNLLIFNDMYFSISQLRCISWLCIVAFLKKKKKVCNQPAVLFYFQCFGGMFFFLVTCHLSFLLFFVLNCSSSSYYRGGWNPDFMTIMQYQVLPM